VRGLPRERARARVTRAATRFAIALALATLCGCGSGAHAGRPLDVGALRALPAPDSSRVVEIVMENAERDEVVGSADAPYLASLIARYALAERSFAIAHPSLPNYLALVSGSTGGVESDCTACTVHTRNLVDELEAAGISWKAYLEDVPTPCFSGASAGAYAKKHNPFIYFDDISRARALPQARRVRRARGGPAPRPSADVRVDHAEPLRRRSRLRRPRRR
jgi:phosphatidylinositol-3-phosphatase